MPPLFLERMQSLLGDEYPDFLASYEQPRHAGIRVNGLKVETEEFKRISPFALRQIPWCETGFYIDEDAKPGKHPFYHAGLYYIQEPSAMAPAEALDVQPGDRVLDLCAAPGGKSTQIAAKLGGSGLLVANDISEQRTKALAKNIELYGVRGAVVLNETPQRILEAFPRMFNKILIDAPCSGEGMFRKDEDMARQWEKRSVPAYAQMQREILAVAAGLLAPGGTIVYSTCTFAPEENEGQLAEFLQAHPDFELTPLPEEWGIGPGRPDWLAFSDCEAQRSLPAEITRQTALAGRLWPHRIEGEGHFVAVLRHQGEPVDEPWLPAGQLEMSPAVPAADKPAAKLRGKPGAEKSGGSSRNKRKPARGTEGHGIGSGPLLAAWKQFAADHLTAEANVHQLFPAFFGSNVYLSALPQDRLNGLKTVRPGWYAGSVKNGRFMPGQPLASALKPGEALRYVNLSLQDGEAVRYLKGETLSMPLERLVCREHCAPKGYVLVCVDDFSLGFGKWQDGMLKNEYPAGWRWT